MARAACRSSARGVPLYALLITLCFALLSLLTSVVAADTLFMVLMAVSGMSGTVTWIVIAYAQYRFRREYMASGGTVAELKYAAPLFPAAVGLHRRVLLAVRLRPRSHPAAVLVLGLRLIAACYLAYYVVRRRQPQGLGDPPWDGPAERPFARPARRIRRAFSFRLVGLFEVVTAGSRGPSPLFGGSHGVWLCACRRAVTPEWVDCGLVERVFSIA